MKFAVAALLGSASATLLNQSAIDAERAWFNHVDENGLSYGTKEEYEFRKAVFKETLAEVEAHNMDASQTHKLTTNFMSTWTAEERKKLNGYKPSDEKRERNEEDLSKFGYIADSVNWVNKGAVTPVKNQGQCGSCWAFSTTGGVEGAHFISAGSLMSFSEQQLVDCDHYGDNGCNGGLMDHAFTYLEHYKLMEESAYPYTARRGTCKYNAAEGRISVSTYHDVTRSAEGLMTALNKQPVSVAIEADQSAFQLYHSGVITSGCGTRLDHGVLAVGYGTSDEGVKYILVKNSWGAGWGAQGYVKMAPDQYGVTLSASYPTTN